MTFNTKMCILVRRDLNMSAGKAAAQVGHASMLFLLKKHIKHDVVSKYRHFNKGEFDWCFPTEFTHHKDWIYGGMKKVVLGVDSLTELLEIIEFADKLKLENNIVHDEGLACITCGAIGPDFDEKIDPVTNHLKLY